MTKKKFPLYGIGTIAAFLAGMLMALAYHVITWTPVLIEIASVTWNEATMA